MATQVHAEFGAWKNRDLPTSFGLQGDVPHSVAIWRPDGELDLPINFTVQFECFRDSDGMRRFAPLDGYQSFLYRASLAGEALRFDPRLGCGPPRYEDQAMRLVFSAIRRWSEHFDRDFLHPQDLLISRSGRSVASDITVIPDSARLHETDDYPPSIAALLAAGSTAAVQDGILQVSQVHRVRYGLVALATAQPHRVDDERARELVRSGLFAPTTPVSEDFIELVKQRLWAAIGEHLSDSPEDFNRWFFPGHGNLVARIANQRRQPGGHLDHAQVRSAILEIGWRAYGYVTRCLAAFGESFLRSVDEPMTMEEERLFRAIYFPQPYFGGLPLLLLLERNNLIGPVIQQLWLDPTDTKQIGILHSLLSLYAEMVQHRRRADRTSKQRSGKVNVSIVRGLDDGTITARSGPRSTWRIESLAVQMAAAHDLRCSHCTEWGWQLADPHADLQAPKIAIDLCCACGGTAQTIEVKTAWLRQQKNGSQRARKRPK